MNFEDISLWLGQHPDWILAAIFGMSMLESLALIGLFTPGIAVLFAIGTAAGSTGLPYWTVIAAGWAGAVCGDLTSYFIGYRFHDRITRMPPFNRHPEWLVKAEEFFNRYGLYGLFVGRFIGPMRPVLPMVAGTLEMPFWRFAALDMCTGPLWAAAYLTPGFVVGTAAGVPMGDARDTIIFIVAALAAGVLVAELLLRLFQRERTPRQADNVALTVLAFLAAFFTMLALTVPTGVTDPLNRLIALEAATLRDAWADKLFVIITGLGDFLPMVAWGATITATLLLLRQWWAALVWSATTLAANAVMQAAKLVFDIERPHLSVRVADGNAFPSGHASMSLVFVGLLVMLAWPQLAPRGRRVAMWMAAAYVMPVSLSRVYLGVHWSSDILAGWALGGAVLSLAWLALQRQPAAFVSASPSTAVPSTATPQWLALTTLATWGATILALILPGLTTNLKHLGPVL